MKLGQALIPNRKDSGGNTDGFNEGLSPVAYLGSYFYGMLQKGHTSDGRQGGVPVVVLVDDPWVFQKLVKACQEQQ